MADEAAAPGRYRAWLVWIPEYVALVALFLMGLITYEGLQVLPARIPTHFGASGLPDGWGPKSTFFLLPAIGLVLYLGITLAQRFPRRFNYPARLTEENRERLASLMLALLRWTKCEILALFGYLQLVTVLVATRRASGLGVIPMFTFIGVLLSTSILFTVWARRVA